MSPSHCKTRRDTGRPSRAGCWRDRRRRVGGGGRARAWGPGMDGSSRLALGGGHHPEHDPTAPKGALAIVEPIDATQVGLNDIVAYREHQRGRLVLHRVVELIDNNGKHSFRTQGDANNAPDARLVAADQIESKLRWTIPGAGRVVVGLRPPVGSLLLIGLPATALLLTEVGNRLAGSRPPKASVRRRVTKRAQNADHIGDETDPRPRDTPIVSSASLLARPSNRP